MTPIMATTQASLYNVVYALVAEEDPEGGLLAGGNTYALTKPTKWDSTVDITDGAEYEQKDGDGGICCAASACDIIKGESGSLELCKYDPLFESFATGTVLHTNGTGDAVGNAKAFGNLDCEKTYTVEIWQRICVNGARAAGFYREGVSGVTFTPNNGAAEEGFRTIAYKWRSKGGPFYLGGRRGILNDWQGEFSQLGGKYLDLGGSLPTYPTDALIPNASLPA